MSSREACKAKPVPGQVAALLQDFVRFPQNVTMHSPVAKGGTTFKPDAVAGSTKKPERNHAKRTDLDIPERVKGETI